MKEEVKKIRMVAQVLVRDASQQASLKNIIYIEIDGKGYDWFDHGEKIDFLVS